MKRTVRRNFWRYQPIDLLAIALLAGIWWLFSFSINRLLGPQPSYILSLLIATTLMALTVHLVRKAGSATLFYCLGAILTSRVGDLGAVGPYKFIALLIAGIIFEVVFLILKLGIKHLQICIIISTAVSSATIPLSAALLISSNVARSMIMSVINLMLTSFFIGVIGSIMAFLMWYHLRTTRLVLQFEHKL